MLKTFIGLRPVLGSAFSKIILGLGILIDLWFSIYLSLTNLLIEFLLLKELIDTRVVPSYRSLIVDR